MEEQIAAAKQPWQLVTSPMSAAYMNVKEMQWTVNLEAPQDKIFYTDRRGDTFEVVDGVSWHEFKESLEQDRIEDLWPILANHRGGSGMASGADMTAGKGHYRWLVKKGRMREAGALVSVLTGAL